MKITIEIADNEIKSLFNSTMQCECIQSEENSLKEVIRLIGKQINQTKRPKGGVYILHNNELFTVEVWKGQINPTIPNHVVLVTENESLKIDKNIAGNMSWYKAIKYDLPTKEQADLICKNIQEIKEAIEIIGGEWNNGWFWTSAKYSSNNAWFYNDLNGLLNLINFKHYSGYVRPVTAFQL